MGPSRRWHRIRHCKIFAPLVFAVAFNYAPQTEMHGYDQRNHTLSDIAWGMEYETVPADTVLEAVKIANRKN